MAAYLVATVRITDPTRFADYAAAVRGMSADFGGESIVVGAVSEVLEGPTPVGERVIVTRFATTDQAKTYVSSPRYQAAKALRAGAAEVEVRLIEA